MTFQPFRYCDVTRETPTVTTGNPPKVPVKTEDTTANPVKTKNTATSPRTTQDPAANPSGNLNMTDDSDEETVEYRSSILPFIPNPTLDDNIRKTAMYRFIRGVSGGLSIPQVNEMLADEYKGCLSKSCTLPDDELKQTFLTHLKICDPNILNCSVFSATEKGLSILKLSVRKLPSFCEIIQNEGLRPLFTTIVVRSINVNDIIKGDEYQTSNKIEKAMHGCAGAIEQFKFALRRYPFST